MARESSAAQISPIRFDAAGQCESPRARSAVIDAAANGQGPVLVLAHGWNNTWPQAMARFTAWYDGVFTEALAKQMRPLVIGVFWPSTWLTFRGEQGPALAAGSRRAGEIEQLQAAVDQLPAAIQPVLHAALAAGPCREPRPGTWRRPPPPCCRPMPSPERRRTTPTPRRCWNAGRRSPIPGSPQCGRGSVRRAARRPRTARRGAFARPA